MYMCRVVSRIKEKGENNGHNNQRPFIATFYTQPPLLPYAQVPSIVGIDNRRWRHENGMEKLQFPRQHIFTLWRGKTGERWRGVATMAKTVN